MWNSFEKRNFPRIQKECGISLRLNNQDKVLHAVSDNIGIGGFCATLPEALDPFSTVQIKLLLATGEAPFECSARVAWCIKHRDFDPKLVSYDIGFEFQGLDKDTRLRLEKFLGTIR